jgi:hypothetical protein
MKPVRKASPSTRLAKPTALRASLGGDAGQQGGVAGRDLVVGQAVDALDVEGSGRDGRLVAGRAVGCLDRDQGRRRGVAVEADHEPAVGRGLGRRRAVQQNRGARRGAADDHAALHETAGQDQARRGGAGEGGEA